MIARIESLRRHLKRGFKRELVIEENRETKHNSCIDHCLLYAFDECKESHNSCCENYIEFFVFFDYLRKKID